MMGIFNFISNILLAVIILIIGFIVAAIVKKIVLKLTNIDKVKTTISKLDSEDIQVDSQLSFINILGDLAYWITFAIFLIPFFAVIGFDSIAIQLNNFINVFIEYIPSVIFAIIIIVIGFLIANFLRRLTYVVLLKTRINDLMKKVMFEEEKNLSLDICKVASWSVYGLVVLIFITQALDLFRLTVMTNVSAFLLGLVPAVIAALVIFIGAYVIGNFLAGIIRNTFNNTKEAKVIAISVRYIILIMGVGLVLNQLGFNIMLLNATYIILLLAFGVAFAISFGVAGIEIAKKILNKQYDKFSDK